MSKTCHEWGRLVTVGISGSRLLPVFFGLSFLLSGTVLHVPLQQGICCRYLVAGRRCNCLSGCFRCPVFSDTFCRSAGNGIVGCSPGLVDEKCLEKDSCVLHYHFDGLLSLLLALVCLNGYLRIGSFRWRMVYGAVAAWVGYLLAGPHLLLAVIAAVLWEVCCGKSRWKGGSLLLLPWGFGLPLLLYGLGWGGEWRLLATPDAYYHPLLLSQKVNYLPGILVLLNVLAACILHRNRKSLSGWRLWTSWGIQICLLAGIFHQGIRHYSNDRNYEIKVLDYYSRTGQWQQIVGLLQPYRTVAADTRLSGTACRTERHACLLSESGSLSSR